MNDYDDQQKGDANDVGSGFDIDDFDVPIESEAEDSYDAPDDADEVSEDAQDLAIEGAGDLYSEDEGDDDSDELVLDAKQQLEEQLLNSEVLGSQDALDADAFEGPGNIIGVGFGLADPEDGDLSDFEPGSTVLNIYVAEPTSVDDVQAAVTALGAQGAASDEIPKRIIVTGPIDANSHRFRMRPAPGGVSCGHVKVTAGTLGCLARARRSTGGCYRRGDRRRRLLMLSNNHVIANSNNARCLDSIIQPGRYDGGKNPRDRIAVLERWVPIRFGRGKVNYVDCAVGWCWPKRVQKELVYLRKGKKRLFRISNRIARCRRGMLVGKSGRTTQLTVGRITDCSASVWVNYGGGRRAFFRNQFIVRGIRKPFSAGGDSGSVVWTWDRRRRPVGLLFAGNGQITICNPMAYVLKGLDIRLFT